VSFWFVSHLASHSFLLVVMLHKILVNKSYASSLGQYFDLIHAFIYFQILKICYAIICIVHLFSFSCWFVLFQCLKRLAEYINEQNQNVFIPRGLMITNPMDRGLRVVSFFSCSLFFVYELCKFICYQSHCVCNTITYMSSRSFGGSRYKNCVYIDTPLTSTVLCDS